MAELWRLQPCGDASSGCRSSLETSLDESDIILATKTQLIYPSGAQVSVDGGAYRWQVPQLLLAMTESHLAYVSRALPGSMLVEDKRRGFPVVHFLKTTAEDLLTKLLIDDVCNGHFPLLRPLFTGRDIHSSARHESSECEEEYDAIKIANDLRTLLTAETFNDESFDRILRLAGSERAAVRCSVLLLRGLLFDGILIVCLKKKSNVNYGLHLVRQPMAVPYEAKGLPSEQAEFGHADVAIVLTCLSFYYNGLEYVQFLDGLKLILTADDPAYEYEQWTSASNLPASLLQWRAINSEDQNQMKQLFNHLKYSRPVIEHYMDHFVFPAHAKQFTTKAQASGWDVVLLQPPTAPPRTTGFSGTNDNKKLLPLNIQQDDLPALHQTSAEVLTYLLQEQNRRFEVAAYPGVRFTERDLVSRLHNCGIRLLIDAGAFVMEMSNEDFVKHWLEIDTKVAAGVYFDSYNTPWVRFKGRKDPIELSTTSFFTDMSNCVVYLDQAHTRGVDLRFPPSMHGAVTLALGQTKDATVQAVMRLRLVATTQKITFFAPPEVRQSIIDTCQLGLRDIIYSPHVMYWLMEQTCKQNELQQGLFIAQGIDYCRRKDASLLYKDVVLSKQDRLSYASILRRAERQSLEQLYGNAIQEVPKLAKLEDSVLQGFADTLSNVRCRAENDGLNLRVLASEEVEQEREVEHQVEEIRMVQTPPKVKALEFRGLHHAIRDFARKGELVGGYGYTQAFEALQGTKIAKKFPILWTESKLYVSDEYMRTVELKHDQGPDENFLRPVEWMLWSVSTQKALIVIPEEAHLILPLIQIVLKPKVVLIMYSAPTTKRMLHFSTLDYYVLPNPIPNFVVPDWLANDLGIFAGKTFMRHEEVAPLREYIKSAYSTRYDWKRENRHQISPFFTKDLAAFLHEWHALRRRGQDLTHTPLGYILQGRELACDHPFFPSTSGLSASSDSRRGSDTSSSFLAGDVTGLDSSVDEEMNEGESDDEYEWDTYKAA